MGRVARTLLEDAGLLLLVVRVAVVELVALPQQRRGLDEAQGQSLGGEPQVPRPGGLLVRQRPSEARLQQLLAVGLAQPAEEDLFDVGVVGGGAGVGGRGQQVGALGGGAQQLVEGAPAHLQVVQEDDGAYLPYAGEELVPLGPLPRSLVHGRVERLEQLRGLLVPVAGEPYDAVGREARAAGGDRVEQHGATGS